MNIKKIIAAAGFIIALVSVNASANLLIYPIRVSFDETERRAEMTLSNTSSQTNTYRLGWAEKQALSEGGYRDLTEEEAKNLPIASSMVRFSPRQVTLQPGERQLVKLSLRRPRDLPEGEYRSHILFKAVPPEKKEDDDGNTKTSINIVLSFAVPVTIQQGKYNTEVSLQAANIAYNPAAGTRKLTLELARKGLHSAGGDISAYWTPEGGKEIMIGKIAEHNFWAELNEENVSLSSTDADFIPSDGRLRIHYEGIREFRGNTYIDESVQIKRSQITIIATD